MLHSFSSVGYSALPSCNEDDLAQAPTTHSPPQITSAPEGPAEEEIVEDVMNLQRWQDITVSSCETFHLLEGRPLYAQRFARVMKYHAPGLAPARDHASAFHIDIHGHPAYPESFLEAFGFYENLAAVKDSQGWFHIQPTGGAAYPQRYAWCGNFQEGLCAVKHQSGGYFHINSAGHAAYSEQYAYAGDFKDGNAVVCNKLGLHTHIDYQGRLLHSQWFIDLDIFHKGAARAKDAQGWFHLNRQGRALYSQRYATIEPFYNGLARVESFDGALLTINSAGEKIAELRPTLHPALSQPWQQLSADMVGFWRTETIATAVQLNIFDCLPGTSIEIAIKAKLPLSKLKRLLRALWELDLVTLQMSHWHATSKGKLFTAQDKNFLASAAIMWSDVYAQAWPRLAKLMGSSFSEPCPLFKAHATDEKLKIYHQAIDGYAQQDFSSWSVPASWQAHQKLIGVGRTAKVWLTELLQRYSHQHAVLLGEQYVLKHVVIPPALSARYFLTAHPVLEVWPSFADAILLPRVLHYWPDQQALKILNNARQALLPDGKLYVFEMLLPEEKPDGGLLDLNMLAESGGQLRSLSEWERLLTQSQLQLIQNNPITPWLNLLIMQAC